jgi:ABC-type multidrug transport system fused ATPase/permease subunit
LQKNHATASLLDQLPRFILEAIAFGGIMLVILYLIKQTGSFNDSIPVIALYVFAGYRLIPALQNIYVSFAQITFSGPSINKLYNDLKSLKKNNLNQDQEVMLLNKSISLKNIYFNYPNSSRTALKNINLNIPANTTVGFVGPTGSGKTTIIDIILGIIQSQKGTLEIDGEIITSHNVRAWQRSIGYVPQHIYLSDDTIAANIAFGVASNNINHEAIEKASKISNLHKFIVNELPQKYETIVGERGIRLSGGQRQRIGIARALYHNPKILILDEATSSLDDKTEQGVMEAVNNLGKDITIIMIAHRLSTMRKCDTIFKINEGKLSDQGVYNDLF